MTRIFRPSDLLKQADEWLKQGYTVLVTPEGLEVRPPEKQPKRDDFDSVSMK